MKSFKQFLEEARSVDPLKLMQRVRRRFAKDSTDVDETPNGRGGIDRKEVSTKIIPLKMNTRVVNNIFDKLPWGEHSDNRPKKSFEIKSLNPMQDRVRVDDDDRLRDKIENKNQRIIVTTYRGKNYVVDGHHAVLGARARGDTHVDAQHIDLDKKSEKEKK